MKNISTVRKFGVGIASLAMVASMAAPAFAADNKNIIFPDGGSFNRIAGDSRIETAVAAAERLYMDSNKSLNKAYLVSADSAHMVDAATSGMLRDGVVLLTPSDRAGQLLLGATIKSKFSNVTELVAIGGKSAVSDDAVANVKKMNSNISKTSRLGGNNRYETNVAVAKAAYPNGRGASTVYLTRGDSMVEALTAGAAANGPVLLVNHDGDVDKATVSYYQDLELNDFVVLGGEQALADAQVAKLTKGVKATDPWTYLKSTAELKANLQTAAATYFGQSAWQQQQDSINFTAKTFDPNKVDDYNYFGLNASEVTTPTAKDPSKINIAAAVSAGDGAKAFVGYKTPMMNLNKNLLIAQVKYTTLKADLDNALATALGSSTKITAIDLKDGSFSGSTTADKLLKAVQDLYGLTDDSIKPTFDSEGNLATSGAFTFNSSNELTGLNKALFDDEQNKLVSGDYSDLNVLKIGSNAATTLMKAIFQGWNADTDVTAGSAIASAKLKGVDWAALYMTLVQEQDSWTKKTQQAKENLIAAVQAYFGGSTYKLVTSKAGGAPRLAGADRYETSAMLAIYLMREDAYAHESQVDPAYGRAYLASGNDAHLIDSVVAGQLTDGPILLVPTKGDINKAVVQQLAYSKYIQPNLDTYMLGGSVAINDSVRDEAIMALKQAKEYAGAFDWGQSLAPSVSLVSNVTDNSSTVPGNSSDGAITLKLNLTGVKAGTKVQVVGVIVTEGSSQDWTATVPTSPKDAKDGVSTDPITINGTTSKTAVTGNKFEVRLKFTNGGDVEFKNVTLSATSA